eukprot:TRINITY_DN11928_c0_g1_i3.p1 TRINITY_DN11928_c0_g1~~TRINITY_DN11928_c0_g1_i3.p1  ORF type:complete len:373 (-),score=71.93 TRINITY_DN11928_c0_g1_i3:147-1265(-)
MSILAISCNIPAGVFMPGFYLGAALGRIQGEILAQFFPVRSIGSYAFAGAAAFTACTTRTASVAIVLLEVCREWEYAFPIFVSTMFGYAVGQVLSLSIFDSLINVRKLPYLPVIRSAAAYALSAGEICERTPLILEETANVEQVLGVLRTFKSEINKDSVIVVINNSTDQRIVGTVKTEYIIEYLRTAIIDRITEMNDSNPLYRLKTYFDDYEEKIEEENKPEGDTRVVKISKRLSRLMGGSELMMLASLRSDTEIPMNDSMRKSREENSSSYKKFLEMKIDYKTNELHFNVCPLAVEESTPMTKIHFMFCKLGITNIYVTKRGAFVGVITKEKFLKLTQCIQSCNNTSLFLIHSLLSRSPYQSSYDPVFVI